MQQRFRLAVGFITVLCADASVKACAVCQGDPSSPLVKGAEAGVLFMAVLTYFLLLGMAAIPIVWTVRARQIRLRNDAADAQRDDQDAPPAGE